MYASMHACLHACIHMCVCVCLCTCKHKHTSSGREAKLEGAHEVGVNANSFFIALCCQPGLLVKTGARWEERGGGKRAGVQASGCAGERVCR